MEKRNGQAVIIVVLIIAIVMAVFANSLTAQIRFHAREETEIYQREQALYLAEIGVNQMIFNINSGTTYNDGDSISNNVSGIGTYTAIYHTPDNSGYGGSAYIESVGTVGSFSRKIFTSIQLGGNSSDAFKYCLYTSAGGPDGVASNKFSNYIYGNMYLYNSTQATTPYPDMSKYSTHWQSGYYFTGSSATYQPFYWGDNNKVVYIEARGTPPTTLYIDFQNEKKVKISIATNATNVVVQNMDGSFKWRPGKKYEGYTFPLITHSGKGTVEFDFNSLNNWDSTLTLQGFIYTAGHIYMNYDILGIIQISNGKINGELIEKDPQKKLGGDYGTETELNYITDYYTNPPPFFIVPNSDVDKVLPGSYREEY